MTYFDQQGSLIDVLNEDLYPIVVPPQGEATFKVGGLAAARSGGMSTRDRHKKSGEKIEGFP